MMFIHTDNIANIFNYLVDVYFSFTYIFDWWWQVKYNNIKTRSSILESDKRGTIFQELLTNVIDVLNFLQAHYLAYSFK